MAEQKSDRIVIPAIPLEWRPWKRWGLLAMDARTHPGARGPNKRPGVYEARERGKDERLTIGKAGDLRYRVKEGLVWGNAPEAVACARSGFTDPLSLAHALFAVT